MSEETAMNAINVALRVAADPKQSNDLRAAVLGRIYGTTFLSWIMVMPSREKGNGEVEEETTKLHKDHFGTLGNATKVSREIGNGPSNADVKNKALELTNFLDVFCEAAQVLAEETLEISVLKEVPEDDEDGGQLIGKPIRAPIVPWPNLCHPDKACCCLPVAEGGCGKVVAMLSSKSSEGSSSSGAHA